MNAVPIDPTKGARKSFVLPHELAAGVDRYRRAQPRITSEGKTFVELIRRGLEAWEAEERGRQEPPKKG